MHKGFDFWALGFKTWGLGVAVPWSKAGVGILPFQRARIV